MRAGPGRHVARRVGQHDHEEGPVALRERVAKRINKMVDDWTEIVRREIPQKASALAAERRGEATAGAWTDSDEHRGVWLAWRLEWRGASGIEPRTFAFQ
eukprot:2996424-Prymnesium_polylepis.1